MNKRNCVSNVEAMRTGRIDDAVLRYGVGRNKMREIGKQAQAEIRFGRTILYNFKRIDEYMDSISE